MKTVLTIAASDSSGGAGIQADIKTLMANGVYASSAVTALTAQNTVGVFDILTVSPSFLAQEIDCVFDDIRPDAVKIGMLPNEELVAVTAERLAFHKAKNVVVDPVLGSTSGRKFSSRRTISALENSLFPIADLITPNIPECERLLGRALTADADFEPAARELSEKYGCAVLLKGGHKTGAADDLLVCGSATQKISGVRINNLNSHGTGCTLSSAIAANLAKGYSMFDSVSRAKEYISGALFAMLDLGMGSGPLNHGFDLESSFLK